MTSVVPKFPVSEVSEIPGWTETSALVTTSLTISLLLKDNATPSFLELGVFKGKFLSYVAALLPKESRILGVDAFYEKNRVFLDLEFREQVISEIQKNVLTVSNREVQIYPGTTYDFAIQNKDMKFDCIHVDASHDAEEVRHDVSYSIANLREGGLLILDDIFNATTPGVAEGFFSAVFQSNRKIAPFAYAGNKVFCTTPSHYSEYYSYLKSVYKEWDSCFPEISGTGELLKNNEENNFQPRLIGYEILLLVGRN